MLEIKEFWINTISQYMQKPWSIVALIIDLIIVFILVKSTLKILKGSRAMQLIKGIIFLILITALSSIFNLKILNY